jgi:hypothetical protein
MTANNERGGYFEKAEIDEGIVAEVTDEIIPVLDVL